MLSKKPAIGKEINAFCGKCKLERTHTIAAMEPDGSIKKVACTMCGSFHNYTRKSETETAKRRPRKSANGRGSKGNQSLEALIDPHKPAKPYDMGTRFSEGDVIRHPKFGLGRVESARPPDKIEVRFQEAGMKLLLHDSPAHRQ